MLKAIFAAAVLTAMTVGGAAASGKVYCSGLQQTGGMDHFKTASWQAFWGAKGKRSYVWLHNNTREPVHIIFYGSNGYVDNTTVAPSDTKTMYFPQDIDPVRIECSVWNGQVARSGGDDIDPDVDVDVDPDLTVDLDEDLGGVSVDVNPEGEVTDLDKLRDMVLKAL